ncbi:MAG: carboxypeptidase regulatory-like domain-containing protein [Acidobacteria bacterium]|nr:carboxypeptidase regulatory-like domain-containing protein [Acidobacteriota bacterium]
MDSLSSKAGCRVCACVLFFCAAAAAQESRGAIGGRVVDAHEAGIPRARVTITNLETGVVTTLDTNDRGAYVAPLLLPGNYRVAARQPGFKRASRDNLTLSVNDNLQIDLRLDVGDVAETITVTESAPLLESADASMGMLLGNKELTELPLAHGNPYQLIALAPGTTFEGDPLLNRPYEPTHIVDYSMGGSVSGTTDITLDGVSNTSKGSNGKVAAGYVPPVDAVGEVRIETSSFDARTGQSSGGVVNISLRSGTNKLRGSAAFTKMKPGWMANSFFGNRAGQPRGDFDYNRWSASLSGPLVLPKLYHGRNRTFFMWAYEALTDQRPRGGTTWTVPTATERKGDFSELLAIGPNYQIYDPATRRRETGSSTRYRQDPFADNLIPAHRFNPVALKVLEYFPLPLTEGTTTADHRNNYPQPNSPEVASYWTHTVRVDHYIGPRDRIFVRGNGYTRDTHRNDYFKTRATGLHEQYHPIAGSFDDVHTFTPTLVLNLRYGYTRFTRQTDPLRGRNFDLTTLGFPQALNDAISPDLREFPVFNINGYFTSLNTGEARFMDTHSLVAALTRLRGNHTLDAGFEYRAYRQNKYNGNTMRSGNYIFDPTWTRGPLDNSTTAPIGQGFASFLLGLPNASSLLNRNGDFAEQSTVWCGYAQDNWRMRRNLTLTIGVRYELEGPLTERFNRTIRDFDASASLPIEARTREQYAAAWEANPTVDLPPSEFKVRGGLLFAGVGGQPRELWVRDANNLAPRVGLAWSLAKRTVFRSGYGIYFGGLGLRRTDVLQNGFERRTNVIPTRDSGLSFYSTLSNPFPDGILEPVGAGLGAMTDVGNSVEFFNPAPMSSYNQRWQASLQRQFGGASVLEAAYVGNRSTKMEIDRDLNVVGNSLLSRSPFFDPERVNYLTANIPNPFRGVAGVNGTMGSNNNISRENLLKPFPQFGAVNTTTYQGFSWYHSLQVRATRRFSSSLGLNGSYTWAKNMLAGGFLNPADPTPYRSLSSADRKHRVTVATMYQLPFGRRARWLRKAPRPAQAFVAGWQLSAICIYQSGAPLTWGDAVFFGDPDGIHRGPHTVEQWFNAGAGFTRNTATRPAAYHYRTWPFRFSNLRGSAMNNVDLSVNKRWKIGERGAEIQFRGEALNAFNHPQFANPNTDQFSTAFGQITATTNYPRQIQVMLRATF